jgi:hypothetical protein
VKRWRRPFLRGSIGCAIYGSVLAVEGKADAAELELRRTLRLWIDMQGRAIEPSVPEPEIARDAMAIRDLLFEPNSVDGLRGQSKSYTPPPFIFMPSTVRVTTGQVAQSHDIEANMPQGQSNVIMLSALEARTLWNGVEQLSACDQGRRSQRLDRLWRAAVGFTKLYCVLAGSWYTAPIVGPIHFTNLERTRARVVVTVGIYSDGGRVAVVEKATGQWKVTGSAGS